METHCVAATAQRRAGAAGRRTAVGLASAAHCTVSVLAAGRLPQCVAGRHCAGERQDRHARHHVLDRLAPRRNERGRHASARTVRLHSSAALNTYGFTSSLFHKTSSSKLSISYSLRDRALKVQLRTNTSPKLWHSVRLHSALRQRLPSARMSL